MKVLALALVIFAVVMGFGALLNHSLDRECKAVKADASSPAWLIERDCGSVTP